MDQTSESIRPHVCPSCGIVTDVPHETQEGCIEALHAEIARVRELLDTPALTHLSDPLPPPSRGGR